MENKDNTDKLLTVSTVATRLNISKNSVITLINKGELEGHRIGNLFRIPETAFTDYFERSKVKPK